MKICFIFLFGVVVSTVVGFKTFRTNYIIAFKSNAHQESVLFSSPRSETGNDNNTDKDDSITLSQSMKNARLCESKGLSPGAGLSTAEEQSDATYADLINTTIDQRCLDELSNQQLESLEKGGRMWEKNSRNNPKLAMFGAAAELFKALSGGAHIENNKFGET